MRRLIALAAVLLTAAACASASIPSPADTYPAHARTTLANSGIRHVFLIVLENESYDDSYVDNPNPYLGKTLQAQGTLLTQYHATGHVSLDNYLAMMSGQAPNPATSSDCQTYTNFDGTSHAATLNADGQAVGVGCIYPRNVKTFADQLSAHHISWAGYMNQMGSTEGREQRRCGVPSVNGAHLDGTQQATANDQYAARHNPFVYFHSLLDSGKCTRHVVRLEQLPKALRRISTTPRFSFITPDLCNDGHDKPCQGKDAIGKSDGGLVSLDHFLAKWVPRIEHSPAFKKDGLIIITSDESETSDSSSCCGEKPGPSDPLPGLSGPGGGRIGTLVIGRCVKAGGQDALPYDHYSLLRSLEDLYRIRHGGTDGHGHLGYAVAKGLRPFGSDLLRHC